MKTRRSRPVVIKCHKVGIFRLVHFPTKRDKFKIDSKTNYFLLIWKPEAYLMNEMQICTHYAVGHQGSLDKASQDISGVVLVIRDT